VDEIKKIVAIPIAEVGRQNPLPLDIDAVYLFRSRVFDELYSPKDFEK